MTSSVKNPVRAHAGFGGVIESGCPTAARMTLDGRLDGYTCPLLCRIQGSDIEGSTRTGRPLHPPDGDQDDSQDLESNSWELRIMD